MLSKLQESKILYLCTSLYACTIAIVQSEFFDFNESDVILSVHAIDIRTHCVVLGIESVKLSMPPY